VVLKILSINTAGKMGTVDFSNIGGKSSDIGIYSISVKRYKVKQSRYRPGEAQNGSRKFRFPGFMTRAQGGGNSKDTEVPLQAWSGPEGSRKLRFPGFISTAQDGDKVISLTHRPPFSPRKYTSYSFVLEAGSSSRP
jgi:hypothetical protein